MPSRTECGDLESYNTFSFYIDFVTIQGAILIIIFLINKLDSQNLFFYYTFNSCFLPFCNLYKTTCRDFVTLKVGKWNLV